MSGVQDPLRSNALRHSLPIRTDVDRRPAGFRDRSREVVAQELTGGFRSDPAGRPAPSAAVQPNCVASRERTPGGTPQNRRADHATVLIVNPAAGPDENTMPDRAVRKMPRPLDQPSS